MQIDLSKIRPKTREAIAVALLGCQNREGFFEENREIYKLARYIDAAKTEELAGTIDDGRP